MKKLILVVGLIGLFSVTARAQMITQTAYSTISEATITVSSSVVTQIDPTQKVDRRAVMVQVTGTNSVWCGNSATVAATTGFYLGNLTYTSGYTSNNMMVFPFTADLKLYCLAVAGASATVHVAQIR